MPEMLASFSVVTLEMVENSETFIKIIDYIYGKKGKMGGEWECFRFLIVF